MGAAGYVVQHMYIVFVCGQEPHRSGQHFAKMNY